MRSITPRSDDLSSLPTWSSKSRLLNLISSWILFSAAIAIGPSFKYDSGKGWFVTAKYQIDTQVRNRADAKSFWLKLVFPL